MSNRAYTDEDVGHCARTLFGAEFRTDESWPSLSEDDRESYRRAIRFVLADLASRGRLRDPEDRHDPHDLTRALYLLADLVGKCTEYGDQDGGFVAFYVVPTGPVHRAIPLLDQLGFSVRPGVPSGSSGEEVGGRGQEIEENQGRGDQG